MALVTGTCTFQNGRRAAMLTIGVEKNQWMRLASWLTGHLARLFERWITLYSGMRGLFTLIYWIAIYPVDNRRIQPSSNWSLVAATQLNG